MQGNAHAVALIAVPIAILVALARMKRRTPTSLQLLIALAVAAVGTLAAPLFNSHLCLEGEPRTQWMILGPCVLLVLLFASPTPRRRTLAAIVFLSMMGLSCHFTNLVHYPGWTGNPDWDGGARGILGSLRQIAAMVVSERAPPDAEMSEGWLRDSRIWPPIQDLFGDQRPGRREPRRTWHTWLTGLYRVSSVPQDFWYPGGRLAEGIARLELRDRPSP